MDEDICPYCTRQFDCKECKERHDVGEIVIECEDFEEDGWSETDLGD